MALIDLTDPSASNFATAIKDAQKGDEIIYHIGEYCGGVHKYAAYKSAEDGICLLYQRRYDETKFAYIAKKVKGK